MFRFIQSNRLIMLSGFAGAAVSAAAAASGGFNASTCTAPSNVRVAVVDKDGELRAIWRGLKISM